MVLVCYFPSVFRSVLSYLTTLTCICSQKDNLRDRLTFLHRLFTCFDQYFTHLCDLDLAALDYFFIHSVLGPILKQRNEPVNNPIAVKAIAELKEISQEELIETLAANTRRLYSCD